MEHVLTRTRRYDHIIISYSDYIGSHLNFALIMKYYWPNTYWTELNTGLAPQYQTANCSAIFCHHLSSSVMPTLIQRCRIFSYKAPNLYNNLSVSVLDSDSLSISRLFSQAFCELFSYIKGQLCRVNGDSKFCWNGMFGCSLSCTLHVMYIVLNQYVITSISNIVCFSLSFLVKQYMLLFRYQWSWHLLLPRPVCTQISISEQLIT